MQVLITCILLVTFLENFEFQDRYKVLDFFAGQQRLAHGGRYLGMPSAALDIEFHRNSRVFDINSDAGFAFLVLHQLCF